MVALQCSIVDCISVTENGFCSAKSEMIVAHFYNRTYKSQKIRDSLEIKLSTPRVSDVVH